MVSTIAPAVTAESNASWSITAGAFLAGSVIGGIVAGALMGTLGAIVITVVPFLRVLAIPVLALAALGYALHESGRIQLPIVTLRRQVPRNLRSRHHISIVSLLFALDLGTGITTFVVTTAVYVIYLGSFLLGSAAIGGLVIGAFGATRGLTTLLLSARLQTDQQILDRSDRLVGVQNAVWPIVFVCLISLSAACLHEALTNGTFA